jgi:hypothetical protein
VREKSERLGFKWSLRTVAYCQLYHTHTMKSMEI